jgi:alginate O-acetyltransferase complex protein AlgI
VVWGLYHGIFLVLEKTSWGTLLEKMPRPLRHFYALLAVMLGWVLFRADTFSEATTYFKALFGLCHPAHAEPLARYTGNATLWALALGIVFSVLQWNKFKAFCARQADRLPDWPRIVLCNVGSIVEIALVLALLLFSAMWLADGTYNPFIYFRF